MLLLQLLGSEVKMTQWIRVTGHPESVSSLVNFPAQCSQRVHLPRVLVLPMLLLDHFCVHHSLPPNDHYDVLWYRLMSFLWLCLSKHLEAEHDLVCFCYIPFEENTLTKLKLVLSFSQTVGENITWVYTFWRAWQYQLFKCSCNLTLQFQSLETSCRNPFTLLYFYITKKCM